MTAFQLAAAARRRGATFAYGDEGAVVVDGLYRLPPPLRRAVKARLEDIYAVIREHSVPPDYTASDIADAARRIALRARREAMRA